MNNSVTKLTKFFGGFDVVIDSFKFWFAEHAIHKGKQAIDLAGELLVVDDNDGSENICV